MAVDTIECDQCDIEFDIMYTEEADVNFCPFCGEDLEKVNEEWNDNYEWEEDE
jgi:uncharacterized paraquat-inducible protein A|tara:strand:+ start:533 stop:691 length:159 start_codon:yes stop_codon:yes gene_type:complete